MNKTNQFLVGFKSHATQQLFQPLFRVLLKTFALFFSYWFKQHTFDKRFSLGHELVQVYRCNILLDQSKMTSHHELQNSWHK